MSHNVDRLLARKQVAIQLTVLGDRQVGKTHLAMLAAIFDAVQGDKVLWESWDMKYAQHDLDGTADIIYRLGVKIDHIRRSNGRCGIDFPSGGCIHFRSMNARGASPTTYDLHIADNHYGELYEPKAKRVIRTICTQTGIGI